LSYKLNVLKGKRFMSGKIRNSEFAQLPVSSDAASARQLDIGNTGQTEIERATTQQKLNALANRAMNGDEDAFNQLFEAFFGIATRYSYKLPEYIREEFLLDMGKRLVTCFTDKKWQDTGIPFEAWIHGTAYNTLREWRRTLKKRSPEIQDPAFPYEEIEDSDASSLDQMLQQEEKVILWSLVMKLPELQATVIYERYALKKAFSEIGEKIGKKEANCRKIHQRALESLRQLMHASGYYPEYEHGRTKKGSGSLDNDNSGRKENEKEAHKPSQWESHEENDHYQESHYRTTDIVKGR
jgi:RNA polymerase sigma-70 factor, ECF subfamily